MHSFFDFFRWEWRGRNVERRSGEREGKKMMVDVGVDLG
jgi:hypothetical protein